jgi:hypothetical protein
MPAGAFAPSASARMIATARAAAAARPAASCGELGDLAQLVRRAVDLDDALPRVGARELRRRAARDHLPARHHGDDVGEPLGLLDVVRRHQHRHALVAQTVDQRPQLLADLGIEPDGGLVEQHEPRPGRRRRGAVEAREDAEDLAAGELDVEVVELGNDAHLHARLLGLLGQPVAQHADLALGRQRLRRQRPHGRRLAGAVGAEQAEADAGRHLEVEPVDGGDLAVALDRAADRYRQLLHAPEHTCRPSEPGPVTG